MHMPAAKAAVDKECETFQETCRPGNDQKVEARQMSCAKPVHFETLMDLCLCVLSKARRDIVWLSHRTCDRYATTGVAERGVRTVREGSQQFGCSLVLGRVVERRKGMSLLFTQRA